MTSASFSVDDEDDPDSAEYLAARRYYKLGWNVIPLVRCTKRASEKYAHWHHGRQARAEVCLMRNLFTGGVAVITGAVSGIVVIDTDGPDGEQVIEEFEAKYGALPDTLIVRSGSGRGVHRYFQHPGYGHKVTTRANPSIKLDIKGDGGIAVLPPTLHENGGRYAVEFDAPIAALPLNLLEFVEQRVAVASGRSPSPLSSNQLITGALSNNLVRNIPRNSWNIKLVQSMLDALPDECADDENSWFKVGCALHSFDSGEIGLKLWRDFSARSPHKAMLTDFDKKWAELGRPFQGRKISIGTLRHMATDYGWKPKPWDWRERS